MVRKFVVALGLVLVLTAGVRGAPEVAAPSCVLMEKETGAVLFEKNGDEPLAPASVTKVMTLLLTLEAIDRGELRWDQTVTASPAAAAKGGSQVYLEPGETMTVREMVKCVTVASANDCACALAEAVAGSEEAFVEKMNARAEELGMEHTHFANCTGLDDEAGPEVHYTTARDIAIMSRQLLGHEEIRQFTTIWTDTIRDGAFGLTNTNKLVRFYPDTTGLKTGYTSSAGYCMAASAEREGMELIAAVMHAASSTDRFETAKSLLDYGFATYTLLSPTVPEGEDEIPVVLGEAETVTVVPAEHAPLLLTRSDAAAAETTLDLPETVEAPVEQGQILGSLTLRSGGAELGKIPLAAASAVPRKGVGTLWRELLCRLIPAFS